MSRKNKIFNDLKDLLNSEIKKTQKHSYEDNCKSVQNIYYATRDLQKYIEKEHLSELKFKKKRYPFGWMVKNKKIKETLDRYKHIIDILNYLYSLNSSIHGNFRQEYKKMQQLLKRKCGAVKYNNRYEYAIFVTDKNFYKQITEQVNCTKIYIQKHLNAFEKTKIIEKLGNNGRNGTIYSDGYYVFRPGSRYFDKKTFLKNSPDFRKAIISLPNIISRS